MTTTKIKTVRFSALRVGAISSVLLCGSVAAAQGVPPDAAPVPGQPPSEPALPGTTGEQPIPGAAPGAAPPVAGEQPQGGAVYTPPPPPPPPPPAAEAMPPAPTAAAAPAAPPRANVTAKFATEFYGFADFDSILDSRQALNEVPGNTVLPKAG